MSLRRIFNMLAAFLAGQGVSVVSQLLVPPIFLHRYMNGLEVYGEWIALSAAVTYLGTINYGIQTYANNQMTIHYNRGELDSCRSIQSSALRLLLILCLVLAPLCGLFVMLPIARWLGLRHVSQSQAAWTLYLLVLQIMVNMIFSLLSNSFLVVGKAHKGANWTNFLRLASAASLAALVWEHASFPLLALSQLLLNVLFTFLVVVDIRWTAPVLSPSLRWYQPAVMFSLLKPSAHFGLLAGTSFLTWQAPLLLIEKLLGPGAVAVFALVRTIYTMSRQVLVVLSLAIGQEITHLVGRGNWKQLRRLYDLSERVVLLCIPVVSVGTLLGTPFLLTVWLHKRMLYHPGLCILMGLTSAAMGIKEHKYQFQSASNQHEELSKAMLLGYGSMIVVSIFTTRFFGVAGFMVTWLMTECVLTALILRMNARLFPDGRMIQMNQIFRLVGILLIAFGAASWFAYRAAYESISVTLDIATAFVLILSLVSYYLFGLEEVRTVLMARLRNRNRPGYNDLEATAITNY
jgi:O-antigen/teichoic acid export membrane protein